LIVSSSSVIGIVWSTFKSQLHSRASSPLFSGVFSGESLGGVLLLALLPGASLPGISGCEHPVNMGQKTQKSTAITNLFANTDVLTINSLQYYFF